MSPRSVFVSMVCPWRSSWLPPGSTCSRHPTCSTVSATGSMSWAAGDGTSLTGSAPCGQRSGGAMSCSTTARAQSFELMSVFTTADLPTLEAVAAAALGADSGRRLHQLAGGQEPGPSRGERGLAALLHVADDQGVRRSPARRQSRRGTRRCAGPTPSTSQNSAAGCMSVSVAPDARPPWPTSNWRSAT